jgi:hypothetical protein
MPAEGHAHVPLQAMPSSGRFKTVLMAWTSSMAQLLDADYELLKLIAVLVSTKLALLLLACCRVKAL